MEVNVNVKNQNQMTSESTNDFYFPISKMDSSLYGPDIITGEELINRSMLLINNRNSTNRRVFKINVTDFKSVEVEEYMRKIKEYIKGKPNE